jgi:hypothetical protein
MLLEVAPALRVQKAESGVERKVVMLSGSRANFFLRPLSRIVLTGVASIARSRE